MKKYIGFIAFVALLILGYKFFEESAKLNLEKSHVEQLSSVTKKTHSMNTEVLDIELSGNQESFYRLSRLLHEKLPLSSIEKVALSGLPFEQLLRSIEQIDGDEKLKQYLTMSVREYCYIGITVQKKIEQGIYRNYKPFLVYPERLFSQCAGFDSDNFSFDDVYINSLDPVKMIVQSDLRIDSPLEAVMDLPKERKQLYDDLVIKSQYHKNSLLFYESIARIDTASDVNALVLIMAQTAFFEQSKEKKAELMSWLMISCASGYPCSDMEVMFSNFARYCDVSRIDCRGKSVEDFSREFVPDVPYDLILTRSHQIATYMTQGQGTELLKSYLEAMDN